MQKTKRIILTVIIAVLFAGALTGGYFGYKKLSEKHSPSGGVSVGSEERYKDFTVTDASGKTVKLSEFIGKPVVINFWASWCAPCKSELPHFNKVAKELEGKAEFLMVSVYPNKSQVKQFVSQNGYTFPLYFDDNEEGSAAYDITGIPVTVFINAEGNVKAKVVGAISEAVLRSYISKIMN